jgi:hypothetical protein
MNVMNSTDVGIAGLENNTFIITWCLTTCFMLFFAGMTTFAGAPQDDTDSYGVKYYEEFIELSENCMSDLDKKQLASIYIKDVTDDGETIIMNYESEYEAFHYWGDSNISFNTLNSLAQLYAIENNCKAVCIDYTEEIEKANNKMEERKAIQENIICETPPTNSPFASFKKYNMVTSRAAKNSSSIIPERCNRFRRKGTVDEWDLSNGKWVNSINSETSKTYVIVPDETTPIQSVSYSEWKSTSKL